jgi:hypothetical protein
VGERRAVTEAHDRVHERGRVNDDLDLPVREPEQEVRLDQLEPFVRERGRVDRDLRAHAPGRVGQRVRACDIRQLFARPAAEWAARGGEDDRAHRLEVAPFQALEHCGVLAVDGQEEASTSLPSGERELAGRDEALLVREGQRHTPLERPDRRGQAGEADDGVQHDVRLGGVEQGREVATDLGAFDATLGSQPVQLARARRECAHLELIAGVDDVERLAPDRPRGA